MPLTLVQIAALLSATVPTAGYCPPSSPQSDGMRDICLIYLSDTPWTAENFRPYVGFLDKTAGGAPRDWFFDAFLMVLHGRAPAGGNWYAEESFMADWTGYIDLLLGEGQTFAGLDAAVAEVGKALGESDRVCPVIVCIPPLGKRARDFGDVDGDGAPENTGDPAACRAINRWYVDSFLERWDPARFPHLRLWGFYWYNEWVPDEHVEHVRDIAAHVHGRGLKLSWIPWFEAARWDKWRELGFDLAIMQPNYAFMPIPEGLICPDEDRLTRNANNCRANGLGVEMELTYAVATSPADRMNLRLYLNHGVDELDGYMNGAVRAWFQSVDLIRQLYDSDLPECQELYEDCYRFHKGTYERKAVSLCEGRPATLNGRPAPELTDGIWMTHGQQPERVASAPAPAVAEVDLGAAQIVGDVRVHIVAAADGEPVAPATVEVQVSEDGESFRSVSAAQRAGLLASEGWRAGFALASFEPTLARKLRVVLNARDRASVALDEIVIFPRPHTLWLLQPTIEGEVSPSTPPRTGRELTDGSLAGGFGEPGGLSFGGASATVSFDLGSGVFLGEALAHAWWTGPRQPAVRVFGDAQEPTEWALPNGLGEGWVRIALPHEPTRRVSFELSGGEQVRWDELQLRPAPNLARGKPYTVEPAFPAMYPDKGGVMLTDGVISRRGFPDGTTVGWNEGDVTILLDLGAERTVNAVRAHLQGGGVGAVWFPTVIRMWASEDGSQWRPILACEPTKELTFSETADTYTNELAWFRFDFEPLQARYLKLTTTCNGWLMVSEVEAISGETNVALGCRYSLMPQPSSTAPYADNRARLTDGDYSRPELGWNRAVGWMEGTPTVVVDLLRPGMISAVSLHCLGGGRGAVFFPRTVTVMTSLDGEDWSAPVRVAERPAEPGDAALATYMTARMSPREARYVRVDVEREQWVMLDEIEVYGPERTARP